MTPDQEYCYSNGVRWRDFRALFPRTEDALVAYATASAALEAGLSATHEIEWRHIYHSRESNRRQLLGLLMLPLGHVSTSHSEFRFTTRHSLSRRQATALAFYRAAGSLAYHICFVGIILAGAGLVMSIPILILAPFSWKMVSFAVACGAFFACFAVISKQTRTWGLHGAPRVIAKDSFDILSIRKI